MTDHRQQADFEGTALNPTDRIHIDGGFWGGLMEVNRTATLPIQYEQCRNTGRIDAFKLEWKQGKGDPPHIFWDSDVGKWIEAAAYSLAAKPDTELEQRVDEVIELIAQAQQPDGYLNTHFTVVEQDKRWSNLRDWHELYCAGHLVEAAVAYCEATGKRRFLDVMCRYVDLIAKIFGPGKDQKPGYPGHEEIELALVKLYRLTREARHLELARFFVDQRGQQPHYFDVEAWARGEHHENFHFKTYEYNQSHRLVREQSEVVGHSVRAMYLYTAMADVAVETGDQTLLGACKRLWNNVVHRRMHITGGVGPTMANEGFTSDYDLPNEGAYLETCAAVGLVFWSSRMLGMELAGEYADVMERALYNGTISGVSADGRAFFYGNPLAVQPGFDGNGAFRKKGYHYRRSEWFGCACCPPNIARMIAQFPGFMYGAEGDRLAVHLYAHSQGHVQVAGQTVGIAQQTSYPWREDVELTLTPQTTAEWTIALRIPGWCREACLAVNGETIDLASVTEDGYAHITREWKAGDRVSLHLPMPVERIEAHPAVRQDCGRVALQRGPVVYCLEETDNAPNLNDVCLSADSELSVEPGQDGILRDIPLIRAKARRRATADWGLMLYRPYELRQTECVVTAIPYFLWANREPGEMLVWIRMATA